MNLIRSESDKQNNIKTNMDWYMLLKKSVICIDFFIIHLIKIPFLILHLYITIHIVYLFTLKYIYPQFKVAFF